MPVKPIMIITVIMMIEICILRTTSTPTVSHNNSKININLNTGMKNWKENY